PVLLLAALCVGGCSSSPPVSISITPISPQTDQGQSIRITANLLNDSHNKGVAWSLSGPGSVSAASPNSITYNAPPLSNVSFTQVATIMATSVADPRKSASTQVTVNPWPFISLLSSLPSGTAGSAYRQVIAESGGTPPFTWTLP